MGGEVLVAAATQIKGPGNSVGYTRTLPLRIVGGPRPTAHGHCQDKPPAG